jgi:hypothetical protein
MESHDIRSGTAGGTLLIIILHIGTAQLLDTVVLATIGAVVSFAVSRILKWLIGYLRRE